MRSLLYATLAVPLILPAQAPQPTLRTNTSEVLLDLVVRDKHGHIIRDLRPDEIQVFEDGVLQPVRHFEFINIGGVESPTDNTKPPAPSATPAAKDVEHPVVSEHTVTELREMSVVSVVIGNLDPRGRKLTLDAMREFAHTELGRNTYVGVFRLGMDGLRVMQTYTNDAAKVSAAVEKAVTGALSGQLMAVDPGAMGFSQLGAVGDTGIPATQAAAYGGDQNQGVGGAIARMMATHWVNEMHDVYVGSMRYLTPLHSLVQAQAEIPGRKVILLFSAGILVHSDTLELLRSTISAANRANVSIYAMDTRGITVASTLDDSRRRLQGAVNASMNQQLAKVNGGDQGVTADMVLAPEIAETSVHSDTRANMAELAEGTGGALLPDTLDMREPIREAIESSRLHYELTYAPTNKAIDGGFRKIEVQVKRRGVRVFARSGYYAVPLVNGQQVYPFELATLKAIDTKPDLHQFAFQAATLRFRPGSSRDQFAFVFQAPTKELAVSRDKDWIAVHVCVTALVKDERGQVVEKISKDIPYKVPASKETELKNGTVSFTAPFFVVPGHYTVEVAAVDRQSMKASVSRSLLDAEPASGFGMSDVVIARRVDPIDGLPEELDPLEARGGKVTPDLSQVISPDPAGMVRLYAVAFVPLPHDAPVDAHIEIWRDGNLVIKSPASSVPQDADGSASILASVATSKLPPGRYEARVSFQYKTETQAKSIQFTVPSGL